MSIVILAPRVVLRRYPSPMRPTNRSLLFRLVLAGIVAWACGSPTFQQRRDWQARIVGTVRASSGVPAGSASVSITPLFLEGPTQINVGRCAGEGGSPFIIQTGSPGRFGVTYNGAAHPEFLCLFVRATGQVNGQTETGLVELDSIVLGPTGL